MDKQLSPREKLVGASLLLRDQANVLATTRDPQDFEETLDVAQDVLDRLRAMI